MKTSLFKKLIAITLSLTLIMSCMMIATPHIHAADSIDFLMNGNKRVGIKQITIDDITYYDIDGGKSTIDPDKISPVEFYKTAMLAEHNGYSAIELWANIASSIYKSAGKGIGWNPEKSFDTNLIKAFSSENKFTEGNLVTTGWTVGTTLKSAQDKMVSEFKREYGSSVSTGAFLNNATGKDSGLELLNDDKEQTVLYNIASNGTSSGYTRYYQAYGIVFYDFKVIPLADDDLAFITAAEGYDSLDAAEADNAPGVKYKDTGSGTPNTSYVSNPSASDTTVSASYSETSSTTVSNFMESSETYTFGQSTEISTEFGVSFPLVADSKMSVSLGFSSEQAISTAYGTEESLTKEITTETVAEVNLPAHTQIGITQNSGSAEIELDYDCPVYITYKAAIFGLNAQFYWDSVTGNDIWETVDYDQGSICVGFGTEASAGGLTAVDNLYNRAIKFRDMSGFEASYGNNFGRHEHQGDGNSAKGYSSVNWNGFIDSKADGSNITTKECVTRLKNNVPLSASGGTMTIKSTSMNTDITGIVPLYNLNYVQLEGDGVYSIAPGGTVDFGKISTAGFNKYNVPFYGYISDGGEWVLCNADGTQIDSVDGGTLDDVSNYQVFTGTKTGTYYVKFLIDETLYDKVDSEVKIKNSDLSSTPVVRINVTETGHDHICAEGPWQTTVAPTCTTMGEQHANCITCGRVMYTQTVAKLDHVPATITTPATCLSEGRITNICGVCLGLISSETIEKLEHNEGVWKIDFEATADHHGQMSRYCTMCDTALESREFELHTHEFGYESITREPTCVANGEKGLFCSICNAMYATEQIEKSGHGATVSVIGKDADCTHDGETHLYCTDCGELVGSNVIPALGHTAGAWETVIEATCEVNGEKHQSCSTCGELLNTDIIEAHGHAAAWITVKEADCKTTGREEYICTICEAVLETRAIEKTEHVPGKWEITLQPTCTQSGLMQQACAICGAIIGEPVVIDAHDHDNGAWRTVLEATCTTDGEKVRECTICEGTIESEVISALGHDDGVWTTALEATCETQGERHKNCTRCGQLIDSERIDALGHTPGPEMTCVTDQVCLVCEEVLVPADGKSHTWTDWETYKEAKFFTEEQQRRVCTSCDLEEYRFVKGTSKCHKYFPHCKGSGEDCWACNTLSNTNGFFRNLGRFIVWFFTENIVTIILFPFAHGHFHENVNLDRIFGS